MLLPWKPWALLSVFHPIGCCWATVDLGIWEGETRQWLRCFLNQRMSANQGCWVPVAFGPLVWLWPMGLLCTLGMNKPIEFDWIRLIWEECTSLRSANDRPLLREWIIAIGRLRFGVFRGPFGMLDWWNTDASLFSDLTQHRLENGHAAWEGLAVLV